MSLLDDVGPTVMLFLRERIADFNELEDVYHEVLMALYEARRTYEHDRPFRPSLSRSHATSPPTTRRHWARAEWEELTPELPERAHSDSPSARPDLEDALTKLPAAQREAFSMFKLDGMSLEVAAARARISVGALKVRAHRAYNVLKKIVGAND